MAALAAVGGVSWRRTTPLRRGHDPPDAWGRPRVERSSIATWLAAAAGIAVIGASALSPGWPQGLRLCAGAWGAFVLTAGVLGRVTAVAAGRSTLTVRRARGADAVITWDRIRQVVPPRTPFGAWRIAATGRAISLMPSDLLGREWTLAEAVRRGALRFDGRAWVPAASETGDR